MDFFYDETFHDRKITQSKSGLLNAYTNNSNDCFIYALLGFDNVENIKQHYKKLEDEIKESLKLEGELKSTTFKKSYFEYGLKSMKRQCKEFYESFFTLLIDNNVIFQLGFISKTEYILTQLINNIEIPVSLKIANKSSFLYGLTKFIDKHRLNFLFNEVLNESNNNLEIFIKKLIELLETVYYEIKEIEREQYEAAFIFQAITLLKYSKCSKQSIHIDNNWPYSFIADGIKLRLNELGSINYHIGVDNEQQTLNAFKQNKLNAYSLDSKESLEIRMVDMLVGFVGRFVDSINQNLKEPDLASIGQVSGDKYVVKRLLSKEWFDIDESTFNFYKTISCFFSKSSHWSSFTLQYCDNALLFFSLFNYFNTYESYSSFIRVKEMHSEYFNTYCCERLAEYFNDMNKI